MLGYIPIHELEQLTIKEWELYIKGARHRRLDTLEDLRTQSIMQARLSGGKDIKKISKNLEHERQLIDKTETSVEHDKAHEKWIKHKTREVQRQALQRWLDSKKK
ncbi:hypothetical protein A9958_07780 [Staphylococcus simulans]|uniref:hypothetical protein n=1 Tax=Staphylococcus simulans TaxID=1286 RepID=UPI000D099629|nr:hypothetical protein [Staphylococcus simulans]AVO02303.1 hypothetical protein BI282_07770 [Staphylococcus simulans]AVO05249.1 hypothetical protein BI283_07735 [Staphylococcus simulans]AWG18852.1 hypothetical protein A9958_07780 [Staphylococcus simulans]AWI01799.1 hypothetical protein A7X73_07665 [Staphylococcus simulans]PTJ23190.1 hypothetical protein BU030_10540 [Staphylococcus simulans]